MLHGEPEPGRRTVVEDIDRIAIETDHLGKVIDRRRDLVEGAAAARHVGLPEPRQVGSDHVKAIEQKRHEVAKHMARARKTMEQQQLRSVRRARFTIEDVKATDVGSSIFDSGHDPFLCDTT
jgi:hypothetical protein